MLLSCELKPKTSNLKPRKGQAMLLAVLAMGGIILGATAIGGFLMIHQIRQTTTAEHSAEAIFAADAGLERGLYQYFKVFGCDSAPTSSICISGSTPLSDSLSNGSSYAGTLTVGNKQILSRGTAVNARRALLLLFGGY